MSDTQRANKLTRTLYTIISVVLFLAYTLELVKHTKTPLQYTILMVLDLGPLIASHIIYRRDPDSVVMRHVVGLGYGVFYAGVCFISDEQMVFTYVVPMLIVIAVYNDLKFAFRISVGASLVAIVHAIYYTMQVGFDDKSIAALEIEVAATILIAVFNYVCSRFTANMNAEKVASINESTKKTQAMLDEIMKVSGSLADEVAVVSEKMTQLSASSEETLASMTEVQTGTQESADSVQTQLVKTEEIQEQISKVAEASDSIGNSAREAVEAINEGNSNLEKLIAQARISDEAGNGAVNEVNELKESTVQMESIVQMIQKVATQTSMLALNASIEAARAGEAGRGFAVVASSISDLASQTKSATEEISDLIASLTKEMEDVASAIMSLVDSNNVQNESAQLTAESFKRIMENANTISSDSTTLSTTVSNLESANRKIVDSIQTISAITEEVTAHTQTTCEATEQNQLVVEDVQGVVAEMIGNADRLKQLR